jgi:citrate lyase subunit beta/citryl-CoA lyase
MVAGARVTGVVLPKAESAADIEAVRAALPRGCAVVALVETARGLAEARALAAGADRLAFGSIDYAADLALEHGREALLAARAEIVLAARLARAPQPIDGVTPGIDADAPVERDARYAASLGFGGKLLVHPAQIIPAVRGFAPDPDEVDHARELLARAEAGAARFHGKMVDRPVVEAARRRVEAYDRAEQRLAAIRAGIQGLSTGPSRPDGV